MTDPASTRSADGPTPVNQTPRVRFGTPRDGWLPFRIDVGSRLEFTVSAVPNDFLAELAGALLAILTAATQAEALINEEPGEARLVFSSAGGRAALNVEYHPDPWRQRGDGVVQLTLQAATRELARPFWRALRELEGRTDPEAFARHWRHQFPTDQVRHLGQLL